MRSCYCDRAAVITRAILQILRDRSAPVDELLQDIIDIIENYLRDEFHDVARQAAAERELPDA
jgi:hypothetical protein